jgi:hypothetical protein
MMRSAGHGGLRNVYKILDGMSEGKRPLGVDGRIILKWILGT